MFSIEATSLIDTTSGYSLNSVLYARAVMSGSIFSFLSAYNAHSWLLSFQDTVILRLKSDVLLANTHLYDGYLPIIHQLYKQYRKRDINSVIYIQGNLYCSVHLMLQCQEDLADEIKIGLKIHAIFSVRMQRDQRV